MSRQTKIVIEEIFATSDVKERIQKINEIMANVIKKSDLRSAA